MIANNNLAGLYRAQGKYAEAEPLYKRSLTILEKALGPDHPQVATSLNNLAALYRAQGKYAEAEPLYLETLETRKRVLGDDHPDTLGSMGTLAWLYQNQGRYEEAEPLYLENLEAQKRVLGANGTVNGTRRSTQRQRRTYLAMPPTARQICIRTNRG